MNNLLYKVTENLKPGDWYLDLGCGDNLDVSGMRKLKFNALGVDKRGNSQADIKEDLLDFKFENNKYSCISSFYVLHFLSKNEAMEILKRIKEKLQLGGYVVLENFSEKEALFVKGKGFFTPEEIKSIFIDWEIIYFKEVLIHDNPHKGYPMHHDHNTIQFIAKKVV